MASPRNSIPGSRPHGGLHHQIQSSNIYQTQHHSSPPVSIGGRYSSSNYGPASSNQYYPGLSPSSPLYLSKSSNQNSISSPNSPPQYYSSSPNSNIIKNLISSSNPHIASSSPNYTARNLFPSPGSSNPTQSPIYPKYSSPALSINNTPTSSPAKSLPPPVISINTSPNVFYPGLTTTTTCTSSETTTTTSRRLTVACCTQPDPPPSPAMKVDTESGADAQVCFDIFFEKFLINYLSKEIENNEKKVGHA